MKPVQILFSMDRVLLGRWFKRHTLSRIVVVILFAVFFGAVSLGLFRIGFVFFGNLSGFEIFGQETAAYIIHASILILLLLALASAVTSSVGLILLPGRELTYLTTLPVKPINIVFWIYLKSVAANIVLLSFAFMPLVIAYGLAFNILGTGFLLRSVLVLVLIVFFSVSLASPAALFAARYIRGKEYVISIAGMLAFFTLMVFLLRFIFPPSLGRLYDATGPEYVRIFAALPLNQWYVPTLWISGLITGIYSGLSFVFIIFIIGLALISLAVQTKLLSNVIMIVRSAPLFGKIPSSSVRIFEKTGYPFIYKDFLSIIRDRKESGYVLFLSSIAVFFFVFLRFGTVAQIKNPEWQINLILFAYAWMAFFATTLFIRFLFPLVSRESGNAKFLYALPVSLNKLLFSKLLFGSIVALPVLMFYIFVLQILPFTSAYRTNIIVFIFWVIMTLSWLHVLLGAVYPDFREGNDPEKVSTSGMGIISLIISIIVIINGGYILNLVLSGAENYPQLYAGFVLMNIAVVAILYLIAHKSIRNHQFSESF